MEYFESIVIIVLGLATLLVLNRHLKGTKTGLKQAKNSKIEELISLTTLNKEVVNDTIDRKDKELNALRQQKVKLENKVAAVLSIEDDETEEQTTESDLPPLTISNINWPACKQIAAQFGIANPEGLSSPLIQNMIVKHLNENEEHRKLYEQFIGTQSNQQSQTQSNPILENIPQTNWV